MKKLFASRENIKYWDDKWKTTLEEKDRFVNLNMYPIKYAEKIVKNVPPSALILEAGCGLGRVLKHYFNEKRKIIGFEYNEFALRQIQKSNPKIPLVRGDITNLPFKSLKFDIILAFGVYHNLEFGYEKAVNESIRVLKKNGFFCSSVRCHNLRLLLRIMLSKYMNKSNYTKNEVFHKWAFKPKEWRNIVKKQNPKIVSLDLVSHVPFFGRFKVFRCKNTGESEYRSVGIEFNSLGKILTNTLGKYIEPYTCDTVAVTVQKVGQ